MAGQPTPPEISHKKLVGFPAFHRDMENQSRTSADNNLATIISVSWKTPVGFDFSVEFGDFVEELGGGPWELSG